MEMEKRSLIALCREHLTLPDETMLEFAAQYKKLTDQDKADLIAEFAKLGFEASLPGQAG
jgi:hypothetical protein